MKFRSPHIDRALMQTSIRLARSFTAGLIVFGTGVAAPVWAQNSPSAEDPIRVEPTELTAVPDTTGARPLLPATPATPSSESNLVWTTMTTPKGHEVRVLRPESTGATTTPPSPSGSELQAQTGLGNSPTPGTPLPRPATAPTSPNLSGIETHFDRGGSVPPVAAFGVYGGYPSAVGFQTVVPTDAPLAFRMGITGFPKLGWLWTPGMEVHFGQKSGRLNTDGAYHFSNLYIGQSTNGKDEDLWGAESGFGYRWLLPDRRGVRWVAAVELGGRWTTESGLPDTPSIRAFWMIAAP